MTVARLDMHQAQALSLHLVRASNSRRDCCKGASSMRHLASLRKRRRLQLQLKVTPPVRPQAKYGDVACLTECKIDGPNH